MPHLRQRNHRCVAFDLETTGLSARKGDRVVEIGAVALEEGAVVGEFHSLVNSGRNISLQVQQIHGISNDMLLHEPEPSEVFPRFREFIRGALLVAHNAEFDIQFLRKEFSRLNLRFGNPVSCTLKLARKCLPDLPNYRLETVVRHLLGEVPEDTRLHRALDDARLAAKIWLALSGGAG